MAETIRDVIIKIRLQQEKSKLEPPDTSAFRDAVQKASRPTTGGGTATAEEKQYDAEAKEAIAAYSRIMREREKQAEEAMRLAERTADYVDNIDATAGQRIVNRAQRNADARAKAEATALAASKQSLESFNAMGEGALRAARGIAFLTAATEDDLRVAIQYVAAAQGVLDVFAGTSAVIKGIITLRQTQSATTAVAAVAEGAFASSTAVSTAADAAAIPVITAKIGATRALTAANAAASASQVALAATSVGSAAAVAGSAGAATAATAATGAMATAAAAAAPPVGILAAAYLLTSGVAEELNRSTRKANQEIEQQSKYLTDAGRAWETYTERTEAAGNAIAAAREQFQTAMDIIGRNGDRPGASADDQIAAIRQAARDSRNEIDNRERRGELGAGSLGRLRADQEIAEVNRREQESILAVREKQTTELQRQRDLAREALETAKRTVEEEKNRLASLEERIGRLSQGERERLKGIAGRVGSGGGLTEADARFLDKTGVGGAQASAFFRQRGQQGGAAGILEGLGETQGLKQANASLRSRLASDGEALKEIEDELANSLKDRQRSYERITQLLSEALTLKELVQRLEKVVEQQGKDATKGRLQNDSG